MLFLVGIHITYDQQHSIKLIKHNLYWKHKHIIQYGGCFCSSITKHVARQGFYRHLYYDVWLFT